MSAGTMARREHLILLLFCLTISTHGALLDEIVYNESTEDDSWSYYATTPTPNVIRDLHSRILQDGVTINSLVTDNPSIQILMEQARKRSQKLEMRLLQWTDYLNALSAIEMQIQQNVEHHEKLEPETLENYAEWCVSLDSGATKGIMERIHNLIVPMFKNQGLLEMLQAFTTENLKLTLSGILCCALATLRPRAALPQWVCVSRHVRPTRAQLSRDTRARNHNARVFRRGRRRYHTHRQRNRTRSHRLLGCHRPAVQRQ